MLRTHAPAAALLARRSTPKGVSRRNFACSSLSSSSPARWRRCSAGGAHRTSGPLICGTGRPLPQPPARHSPLPLLRPPPRLRRRRPAAPTCACTLSAQQRSACTTRRTPGPPKRLPPPRARPRRKGASRGPSLQPSPPPPPSPRGLRHHRPRRRLRHHRPRPRHHGRFCRQIVRDSVFVDKFFFFFLKL